METTKLRRFSKKLRRFSKSKTDQAGELLCSNTGSQTDIEASLEVLSEWRSYHSYPMNVFKKRIKRTAERIDSKAITAQRLKRVPSIIKKLNRKYENGSETMRLTQMQDIAGCRAVMSDVGLVKKLYYDYYINGDLKHERVSEKDYITNPKKDGYRSIHLVYRYKSDRGKSIYNGLLVEVQIRSQLQHVWATAVETVGFFTGKAIKSNEGERDWEIFFKLVSSAFAKIEGCPTIPDINSYEEDLYGQIRQKEKELNVISKMGRWMDSLRHFETLHNKKNMQFFLLELDTIQEKLIITPYSKRQEHKAMEDYLNAEKKIYGKPEYDVVLVGADTFTALKSAYPNYFLDTREFIKQLSEIMGKQS